MASATRTIVIIPARMESSRFPGKPLAKILGLEMIVHCLKRAQLSKSVDEVVVATCNSEIVDAVQRHGGKAVMTANTHQRCTDRIDEALQNLKGDYSQVIMVQGDEPMVHPDMLTMASEPLIKDPSIACTNLVARITTDDDFQSPHTIKVVMDDRKDALYMSREPIPYAKLDPQNRTHRWKQVCVMGFTPDSLPRFCALPPTPLEVLESVDMNRFLGHGLKVRCIPTEFSTQAVDTPADLKAVEALMRSDPIVRMYM